MHRSFLSRYRSGFSLIGTCVAPFCSGDSPLAPEPGADPAPAPTPAVDEPAARALYDQMIGAMRAAKTLSYESHYRCEAGGRLWGECTYKALLKKPNFFRIESASLDLARKAVLIGDGTAAWLHWPTGRPGSSREHPTMADIDRYASYMTGPTCSTDHSIGHQTDLFGTGMIMPILDPSIFHGHSDSMQPYLDGVRRLPPAEAGGEECDHVEVSIMKGQRVWELWISRRDHLPRRLTELVRVVNPIHTVEEWSDVVIDGEIPDAMFVWTPPKDSKQWSRPKEGESLLKPGEIAPDFELDSIDGGRIRLSNYRGKVVWLTIWRVGCPPCREDMVHLQRLHEQFQDKGLVLLGLNFCDEKQLALDLMRENGVSYPNILDLSEAATDVAFSEYRCTGIPQNHIIDREGVIVDAWLGQVEDRPGVLKTLERLGIH